MKQPTIKYLAAATALLIFSLNVHSQGFGLGTNTPSEILHLFKNGGDVAIRYQAQASGSGSVSTGPNSGVTITDDASIGTIVWGTTANAGASDNAYATATSGTSHYLNLQNFGFAVPGGATIDGIKVEVEKSEVEIPNVTLANAWTTTDNTHIVGAGSNRLLILVLAYENNAGSTCTGVTYGTVPQAMTLAANTNTPIGGTDNFVYIYYLNDAGIVATTGGSTFTPSFSGGAPTYYTHAVTLANVDQTTPIGNTSTNFIDLANQTSIQLVAAVTVAVGDMVITGMGGGDDATQNNPPAVGYTESTDQNGKSGGQSCFTAYKSIAGAGTEQPTIGFSSMRRPVIAGIVVKGTASVSDNSVKIIKGGVVSGTEMAVAGEWATTDAYTTYGSSTNLWGLAWTDADINAANFGIAISATSVSATARVDHVRITVWYTAVPAAYTNFTTGIDATTNEWIISESSALGTSDVMKITGGNICYTGGLAACSDVRYKKNIQTIRNPLNKVMQLDGVTYKWKVKEFPEKKFTEEKQIGFIAQEVEKVFPEVVFTDTRGYKSVDYSRLTPILVEAMKEQQKRIQELEQQVNRLKNNSKGIAGKSEKYAELEARISSMEILLNNLSILYTNTNSAGK